MHELDRYEWNPSSSAAYVEHRPHRLWLSGRQQKFRAEAPRHLRSRQPHRWTLSMPGHRSCAAAYAILFLPDPAAALQRACMAPDRV